LSVSFSLISVAAAAAAAICPVGNGENVIKPNTKFLQKMKLNAETRTHATTENGKNGEG